MAEYTLQTGRPADAASREAREYRCYDLLDKLGVAYERIDHERAETMEACAAVDEALGAAICKNLFLCNRQQTAFYLLLMPADKPFKTKELSSQINSSRLSFATAEHMLTYLDITPGSVSVLGLMNDHDNAVKLLIDEDLLSADEFGCHPCVNTSSLKLKIRDLLDVILPAVHHTPTTVTLGKEEGTYD